MSDLLQVDGLTLGIGSTPVCNDLSLRVTAGQSWAVMGRNGTGKSTLLHRLAGLGDPPTAGRVRLSDRDLAGLRARERARRVALLLQHSDPGFGHRVVDTVRQGRYPHQSGLRRHGRGDDAMIEDIVRALGLETLRERPLHLLSGGELRRVELGRLLAQAAPLSLLDEPLNHLDLAHQGLVLDLLSRRCVGAGRACMMVLHDLDAAYRRCDHWLLLCGSGDWLSGPRETLADSDTLGRVFGHPILRLETDDGPVFRARL